MTGEMGKNILGDPGAVSRAGRKGATKVFKFFFVSSYTTAIDSITACLAHAPKKYTQSGIFQFDINATFQNTGSLYNRA